MALRHLERAVLINKGEPQVFLALDEVLKPFSFGVTFQAQRRPADMLIVKGMGNYIVSHVVVKISAGLERDPSVVDRLVEVIQQ